MNNSKFHFTLCILILLAFLSSCSGFAAKPTIELEPCSVDNGTIRAECGYLHVPEDRDHPEGRTLDLKVIVVRAREPDHEPDPLFYLAGGPGGAATDNSVITAIHTAFWNINARRDMVFLDQRGTNDMHRLSCDPMPDEVQNGTQQQVNDWMKQCLSTLNGDPRFYTTAAAMQDLETARSALGYDKINLFGGSYGVIAAQVYMRMFPQHVRAAVLFRGTALDLPFFQALPNASQSALDQIFAYCEQDEYCHAAYPDLHGEWKRVLARLAKGPVVTSYTLAGAKEPVQVDQAGLAGAIHEMMKFSGGYANIPLFIHTLAANEDWTPIVQSVYEQHGSPQPERLLLMEKIIWCFEPAWGNLPEPVARLNPDAYGRDAQVRDAQFQQKICASLPKPDPSLIYGPGKPAPLSALMINSLLDPMNPPSNIQLALKEFTKSRLVVEPTEGHYGFGSTCTQEIFTQYIEQGSVDGLDTSCLEKIKRSFVTGD